MDKRANKKTGEELQMYLHFRKRGGKVPAKKLPQAWRKGPR